VSDMVDISRDAVIDVNNQRVMTALVKAMIQMENGKQPYPEETFKKAYSLI
ncbi:structural protein, partial [Xenorhabdus griffiniae]|nr:structural protein [Xenorhabdus griffiniae]